MDELFNNIPLAEEETEETKVNTEVNKEPKEPSKDKVMVDMFMQSIKEDPELKSKLKSRSNDLAVLNTLSYGTSGGLIPDKSKPKEPGKDGKLRWKPISVPEIVGYRLQNTGKDPIEYVVSKCTANEAGIYEVEDVQKVLKPGQVVDLPRKYFTMLTYRPEFSFTLANGTVSSGRSLKTLDDMLTKPFFTFSEKGKGVHDDDVKISISEEVDGKTVMFKEYIETFGFLNNPTEKAGGKNNNGSGRKQVSTQELTANFIRMQVENSMKK